MSEPALQQEIPRVDRPEFAKLPDERVLEDAFHAKRRGDYQEAIERFLCVFQRDEENPFVLVEAARCEGMRMDFGAMRALLDAAGRRSDDDPLVWRMIGDAWMWLHRPDDAIAAYRQALSLDPADTDVSAALASALERSNRLDEANRLFEGLTPAQRRSPAFQLVRLTLARRSGRLEKAIEWAQETMRFARLQPHAEAPLLRELALAHDGLGKAQAAWKCLLRVKAIHSQNPEADYERKLFSSHLSFLKRIEAPLTPRHFALWEEQAKAGERRRIAFLLGHPRSGTTIVERILDAHPKIAAASEYPAFELCMTEAFKKRPGELPALLEEHPPGFSLEAVRSQYWKLMEKALGEGVGGRLLLDKNPGLTDGIHALARIFPEARFLVMLRDPRDVLLSCFFQDFGLSRLGVACHTLKGAVSAYEATMQHWVAIRNLLPADRFLECRYEDFVAEPDRWTTRLMAFLLPETDGAPVSIEAALQSPAFVRTPSYAQIGTTIRRDSVARWPAYAEHFALFKDRLSPLFEALGYVW